MGSIDSMVNATPAARHIAAVAAQGHILWAVGINAYGEFRSGINIGMSSMRNADRHGDDHGKRG